MPQRARKKQKGKRTHLTAQAYNFQITNILKHCFSNISPHQESASSDCSIGHNIEREESRLEISMFRFKKWSKNRISMFKEQSTSKQQQRNN